MNSTATSLVRKEWLWVAALTVAAGWLFLANLGDQLLWDDEAQTALIAKTVLTHGVPMARDDKNSFSQESGREYGRNYIYRWHTWFPFYLLAGTFSILGVDQWTARLPFALMGVATVPLCYWFARSLWESRRAAVLAALLLATSVPFLILSRQCRYYSPCMFFSLLGLIAYYHLVRHRRWAPALFVISAVLLFHSMFLYWAILLAAVLVHAAIFHRDRFIAVAFWSGVTFLLNLPWLIWLLSPPKVGGYPDRENPWYGPFVLAGRYFAQIFLCIFSPALVVLAMVMSAVSKVREKRFIGMDASTLCGVSLLLLFVGANYAFVCLATPIYFFRYIAPVIPPACLLAAKILDASIRVHWGLGVLGLAAILGFGRLPDYYHELTHHYVGPVEGMATYLNEHGKPDDVVAITYGDMPLKFYTPMRIIGGLAGDDMKPALTADWIIIRHDFVCKKVEELAEYLEKNVPWNRYRKIVLDYPDSAWNNREEPYSHYYRTPMGKPPVVIYQKIRND
jgi:4-amino-4-deoxy-L-arabinose transferase-like glycosyltransferase